MERYNFVSKTSFNVLDSIKFVVNNCPYISLVCPREDASIVELFDKLFVGYPVELLGELTIGGFNSETTGWFAIGYDKVGFSIHNDILYLRATK